MTKKQIEIYTDGACRGNPGPGGWGVLLRYSGREKKLKGSVAHTTNNRMELTAAIKALEALKEDCHINIYTDSKYVKNGVTEWMENWKKRGWKTSNKKPVKNVDLWQELDVLIESHDIEWHWVKGHSGHKENDIVDQLANDAIDEM